MKPGRVKRNSGLIGSPFYSSFHSLAGRVADRPVVSFNGATSLILGSEICSQGCHEFLVISISFRTTPVPLELTGTSGPLGRSPLVLTSAITLAFVPLK